MTVKFTILIVWFTHFSQSVAYCSILFFVFVSSSLTGKIELSLEVLEGEAAKRLPVGRGQEEPNVNPKLDPPNRPDTSFFWLTSPLKVLRHVVWRRYKWCCFSICLLGIAAALLVSFVFSFPGNLWKKLLNVGS